MMTPDLLDAIETIVRLDKEGYIFDRLAGGDAWTSDELRRALDKLSEACVEVCLVAASPDLGAR
jgi:hypothetical protein